MIEIAALIVVLAAAAPKQQSPEEIARKAVDSGEALELRWNGLVPYSQREFDPFGKDGEGTVPGEAFAPTRGGGVVKFAGRQIVAIPSTEHTKSWLRNHRHERSLALALSKLDPRVEKYLRTATTDSDGKFVIDGLPPGFYIVAAELKWDAGKEPQGGVAIETVRVPMTSGKKLVLIP